ncbi:hypothetical protein [Methanolobus sp. WCC4]|uniref:hypothetical protein n=1 Tax=Methanolobus sp. WCC4 TaxID=3125784 RepID=UPI0030FC608D
MLITSSRKPSAGTRTLCKHLASFFGCEYSNRGKMSMGEVLGLSHDTSLIVVGEYHGNPGSIAFYGPKGNCILSLYISMLSAPVSYSRFSGAVIEGDNELVPLIAGLLTGDVDQGSLHPVLDISENIMTFKEQEKVLFSLKIRSYKVYEGDEDCSL